MASIGLGFRLICGLLSHRFASIRKACPSSSDFAIRRRYLRYIQTGVKRPWNLGGQLV